MYISLRPLSLLNKLIGNQGKTLLTQYSLLIELVTIELRGCVYFSEITISLKKLLSSRAIHGVPLEDKNEVFILDYQTDSQLIL